ncbi:hypothetical protein AMELA_G00165310, partial [Ameiurus melas]
TTSTVKYGGDIIVLWFCFSSAGTGALVKIERIMESSKFQSILEQTLQASVRQLKINNLFTFLHLPNDPKHKFKSIKEQLQKKIRVVE